MLTLNAQLHNPTIPLAAVRFQGNGSATLQKSLTISSQHAKDSALIATAQRGIRPLEQMAPHRRGAHRLNILA